MAADPITKNTVSDLLNYDISDDDDPFKDIGETLKVRDDKPTLSPRAVKRKAGDDKENDILGLDEEVKITKKRKPIAKLDETRLLSQLGIPKLRALARSGQIAKKLHLKGKGHEFSDAANLLNHFQLWLDNLYPRAKFADGLQLVEKTGHSKRMQNMRKEWIDEGKPGYGRERHATNTEIESGETMDVPRGIDTTPVAGTEAAGARTIRDQSIFDDDVDSEDLFFPDTTKNPGDDGDDGVAPEDDELDALLTEQNTSYSSRPKLAKLEPEGEDDLDALLAEQESDLRQANPLVNPNGIPEEDDDLDALLNEHDVTHRSAEKEKGQEVVEDDADLNVLHAKHNVRQVEGEIAVAGLPSPFSTIDDDEEFDAVQ